MLPHHGVPTTVLPITVFAQHGVAHHGVAHHGVAHHRGTSCWRLFRGPGQSLAADLDLGLGCSDADPGRRLYYLAGLQRLVYLEKMLDLKLVELRDVGYIPQMSHPRISRWHAQYFVVSALLIAHPEHPDRAAADQAAGECRLLQQHQGV